MRPASVQAVLGRRRARASAESVPAALRGTPVPTAPGTVEAVADSAGRIVRKLKALNAEIKDVRNKIEKVRNRIKEREGGQAVDILRSVPGIGAAVPVVILSEAFDSVRRADLHAPGCDFGVAPVTKRSGQAIVVRRRLAGNAACRRAMAAIRRDKAGRANCHALRSRGHKHARAPGSVADRLLAVVCRMIETGQTFDPERQSKGAPWNPEKNA